MYQSKFLFSLALGAACVLSQMAAFADETTSQSVQVSTPTSSSSVSKQTTTNSGGSATKVQSSTSNGVESKTKSYKAVAGPNGAKVSATKTSTGLNADGSVSTNREHESHTVNDAGVAHHKSSSSTTVGADGSSSSVKAETHKTEPN